MTSSRLALVVGEQRCLQKTRVERFRQALDELRLEHLGSDVRVVDVVRVRLVERTLQSVGVDVDRLACTVLDGLELDVASCTRLRRVVQSEQVRTSIGPGLLLIVAQRVEQDESLSSEVRSESLNAVLVVPTVRSRAPHVVVEELDQVAMAELLWHPNPVVLLECRSLCRCCSRRSRLYVQLSELLDELLHQLLLELLLLLLHLLHGLEKLLRSGHVVRSTC